MLAANEVFVDNKEKEIYRQYIEVISAYIVDIQILTGKFPVAILNEVRDILSHLAWYHLNNNDIKELEEADGHVKRAIFDCYKYLCLAIEDKINDLKKEYSVSELKMIDNGNFYSNLQDKIIEAKKNYKDAYKIERQMRFLDKLEHSDVFSEIYFEYGKAYKKYDEILGLINAAREKLKWAKRKNKFTNIMAIIGIISSVITIVTGAYYGINALLNFFG